MCSAEKIPEIVTCVVCVRDNSPMNCLSKRPSESKRNERISIKRRLCSSVSSPYADLNTHAWCQALESTLPCKLVHIIGRTPNFLKIESGILVLKLGLQPIERARCTM